jgi:hypothetical protein
LEHKNNNVAAVGESKLSIKIIVVVGKPILLFCLLKFYLLLIGMRFKANGI